MDVAVRLRPLTLGVFEEACLALGLSPDEVRAGRATPLLATISTDEARAFVRAVVVDGGVGIDPVRVAPHVAQAFFRAAFEAIDEAARQADFYARRTGYDRIGPPAGGTAKSLALQMHALGETDWHTLRNVMPLRTAMYRLLTASVGHFARHPDKYLS